MDYIVSVLIDFDPVTGQGQLDSIEFNEILELYKSLDGGDCIKQPSDSYIRKVWADLVEDRQISIRDQKTVSKCGKCIELRTLIRTVRAN